MDPAFSRTSQALGTPIANALESKFQFYRNALDILNLIFLKMRAREMCAHRTLYGKSHRRQLKVVSIQFEFLAKR